MDVDPIKVDQKTILSIIIMKTKQMICGDIFIIPYIGITIPKHWKTEEIHHMMSVISSANSIEYTDETKFVQVQFCTPGNMYSDWGKHRIDGYEELKGWSPLSSFLPIELFDGKKEGDVVTINLPIIGYMSPKKGRVKDIDVPPAGCKIPEGVMVQTFIKVSITLAQTKYKYYYLGKFEMLLKTYRNRL